MFLSIHANSDPNRAVRGIETFLLNLRSSDKRSKEVAMRENTVLGVSHGDLGAILLTLRVNHKKNALSNLPGISTGLFPGIWKDNMRVSGTLESGRRLFM